MQLGIGDIVVRFAELAQDFDVLRPYAALFAYSNEPRLTRCRDTRCSDETRRMSTTPQ